jgi:GR25 family glycosyltransferase involved in LPS biosynthesis
MLTQDKIPIFITHHKPNVERKEFILEQFNKQGLYYEFIDGFHPDEIQTPVCDTTTPSLHSLCLKHEAALKETIKRNCEYCIVFEDDIILNDNFKEYFNKFFPEFQKLNGDLLMIGTAFNISPSHIETNTHVYWEPHFNTRCTHAMLFTAKCAQIILDEYHVGPYRGPDHKLNDIIKKRNLKSCYLEPGLYQSSIGDTPYFKFSTSIKHNS